MKYLAAVLLTCSLLACSASVWAVEGRTAPPVADKTVTGTATLISAASPIRSALNCTNTHATVHVRWGDSTITATSGQQLRAGTAIEILNSAAIYMISEGVNVTVSCTEETR